MIKKLLIFPFGGTAIEALDCLGSEYSCIGFISDDNEHIGTTYNGINVMDREAFSTYDDSYILAVPGSPDSFRKRKKILNELNISPSRFAQIIHPKADIGLNCTIGNNVLIMAGVVLTSNAIIGNHVCILPNSVIHHDTVVEDYNLIGANVTIAGNVMIAENCYIGAAASIRNGIKIESESLVGMGSNVIKSCSQNSKLVGNPAKNLS